ncbi:hypothetical protein Tco_0377283 [Tanacetum coccineum]
MHSKKTTTITQSNKSKQLLLRQRQLSQHKLLQKVRKGKPNFQLVDEDNEAQQESVHQEEGDDPDLELAKKMSLEAHQEKGEGEGTVGGVVDQGSASETTPTLLEVFSSLKPYHWFTPLQLNTEATTITTSLPEITSFIALQLRVARLEQEMSEIKKTDHSADVLASIKSQVPTVVDKYLGTKLDDALLRSEKVVRKEIMRIEKGTRQDTNRNPAKYHLYHALMEALIADEDAMDTGKFAVKVSNEKKTDSAVLVRSHLLERARRPKSDPGIRNILNRLQMTFKCRMKGCSDMWTDTDNAHIPKVSTTTWFKPIPESERTATLEPETKSGQRMSREEAKTSSLQSTKDYSPGGSFEVVESLVGGRIEILTTG